MIDKTYGAMGRELGFQQMGVKLGSMYHQASILFPRAAAVASRLDSEVDTMFLVQVLAQDNGVALEPRQSLQVRQIADLVARLPATQQRLLQRLLETALATQAETPGQ